MDLLRRLFGGGAASPQGDDGLYFYVQPDRCAEIVRVRVHRYNDLSEHDDGGYRVRKSVRGVRCFTPVELELYFRADRHYDRHVITGGTLVDEAAWVTYTESGAR